MAIHPANARYKEKILTAPYEICIERARYYTQSYRETEGQHPCIRAARAFEHTLKNMSLYILDEELIAGNRTSKLVAPVIPVERGEVNEVLELDLDFLLTREKQPYRIDPAERKELETEILPYWRGKTVRDRKNLLWKENGLFILPSLNPLEHLKRRRGLDMRRIARMTGVPRPSIKYFIRAMKAVLYNNIAMFMNVFDVQGHLILGIRNVLAEGFAGLRGKAEAGLKKAKKKGDADRVAFLESVIICCDAVRGLAQRYAALAKKTADETHNPARRKELLTMAECCRHVPENRPRNFREAVQAVWFTELTAFIAYGMTGIFAVGRIDQYLFPFYMADRARGTVEPGEATRLMEELLIKFSGNLLLLPFSAKRAGSELGADSCSPTIGGLTPNGQDATNELTGIILDAFVNIKSMGNSFTVRLSEKTPDEFWRKTFAAYRMTSGAALFNDEVAVPALVTCGISEPDARDYGVIGCVEPTSDGNTFACTSGNDISLPAALEMTLLNGRLRIMGKRIGPTTGDPRSFRTFDELMDAFKKQVSFMVGTVVKAVNLKDRAYMELLPCPYVSATLAGCIESATDMTRGGARYNFSSVGARGFGTAVDALAAIREHVYDNPRLSMKKLLAMLDRNFRGDDEERARLASRSPRYGCGDEKADAIAKEIAAFFCSEVAGHANERGGSFRPGFFSYGMHVLDGMMLGALPSGRLAGEPVSNSFSPANGSERNGPTAMLRSVAGIDHSLISNGCAVNMKFLPSLFEGEERVDKMIQLVRTYFTLGGMELQPNVVSNEVLRDAQAHPERYRDLAVRVSGYSALFTDLGKAIQDEIIQRTEFSGT
jgi:pyruvate formate-lyase/glycerol dehydratase family glycyl radical enzyme